ncbi:response regulator transcription factor [Nonlabens agnitus]|uniref:HTH luxR-type domain-containing protein n=1 Tax=Nonlabens agnitus TaxID=870484 RepID=A0A2S9WW65_9FLAO|nr:LuxR C-terminal-related transcriptional regulator [Nonlabens agnitus]PRP67718.1 hypothetical protein BST86_11755 [Nonlabens agnitus]
MTQLYQSDFLNIHTADELLIQEWTGKQLTVDHFKRELKNFLWLFKKSRLKGVLWLQERFTLDIPNELHDWIEKNILEPQYKFGLRRLAFTIPKDQEAHISIIDSFNKVNSVMQPRYFVCRDKAIRLLLEGDFPKEKEDINYEINRSIDATQITLEVHHRQLPHAIRHLDKLKEQFQFRINHTEKFEQLTLRELEILKAICRGDVNREIAERLFLSESTVATHRKSIVKKLGIKSSNDWHQFGSAFL